MDSFVEASYLQDTAREDTNYISKKIDYVEVIDKNDGHYNLGTVKFHLEMGNQSSQYFDLAEARFVAPISVVVKIENAAAGEATVSFDPTKSYNNLLSVKNWAHIFDSVEFRLGSTSLTNKSQFSNFVMQQKINKMNEDELRLIGGPVLNYYPDSTETQDYIDEVGDFNSVTAYDATKISVVNDINKPNTGLLKRLSMVDDLTANKSSLTKFVKVAGGSTYLRTQFLLGGIESVEAKIIKYNFTCVVPLKYVHDCFKQIPSMTVLNCALNLVMNVGSDVKHTVKLTTPSNANLNTTLFTVDEQRSVFSTGRTSAFQLSGSFSHNGVNNSNVLVVTAGSESKQFRMSISYSIGHRFSDLVTPERYPCRLIIPLIDYTPEYHSNILSMNDGMITHKYNDYVVSTYDRILQGSHFSRQIANNIGKPRKLYVLPYLCPYTSSNNIVTPSYSYSSIFSSCPNTCIPIRFRDFQIKLAGQNLFNPPLQREFQFYENSYLNIMGERSNGNSIKGDQLFQSGLVDKKRFTHGMGYCFDLKRADTTEMDMLPKTVEVEAFIEGVNQEIAYQLVFIVEFEASVTISRITGVAV